MALAEARAAWQRTANRCLVQEDAKRAPKLACCSSVHSSFKHTEPVPSNADTGLDTPTSNSPFHQIPSYSNLSPNTIWWLQTQPNYGCQRGLMDEKPSQESSVASNEDDFELIDQISATKSSFDSQCKNFVSCETKGGKVKDERLRSIYHHDVLKMDFEHIEELRDMGFASSESSKGSGFLYSDSGSSWVGTERSTPWWRTADTEDLAFLVAQKSLDLIENCDLPSPQKVHKKKNHSEISTSLPAKSAASSCKNLRMVSEEQLLSSPKHPLRTSAIHERNPQTQRFEGEEGKSRLLEALRHSQTRAREAETVAKQACAEKDHILKLVIRQAQQLFAYKQWVQLLQLENMYYQLKDKEVVSEGKDSPPISPWTTPRKRKMEKGWMKPSSRTRARRTCSRSCSRPRYDVEKYAVVFALGLGLVGAGLLLGWTIGWMLPMV